MRHPDIFARQHRVEKIEPLPVRCFGRDPQAGDKGDAETGRKQPVQNYRSIVRLAIASWTYSALATASCSATRLAFTPQITHPNSSCAPPTAAKRCLSCRPRGAQRWRFDTARPQLNRTADSAGLPKRCSSTPRRSVSSPQVMEAAISGSAPRDAEYPYRRGSPARDFRRRRCGCRRRSGRGCCARRRPAPASQALVAAAAAGVAAGVAVDGGSRLSPWTTPRPVSGRPDCRCRPSPGCCCRRHRRHCRG